MDATLWKFTQWLSLQQHLHNEIITVRRKGTIMENNNGRFIVQEKSGSQLKDSGLVQVIVDRVTGVNYLWIKSGYAGGITPLLDADGKPIITPVQNR